MKEIQHKKLLLNRRGEEMETWKCMKVVLMTRGGVALCFASRDDRICRPVGYGL